MIEYKTSDATLETLIAGLEEYKNAGVVDPWILSDGTKVEPLEILKELLWWRKNKQKDGDIQL